MATGRSPKTVTRPPQPGDQPTPSQSVLPKTYKVCPEADLIPTTFNECHIPLEKVSLKKFCAKNNINYRLVCLDYDIPRHSSSESDSEEEEEDYVIEKSTNNRTIRLRKRKKEPKKNPKLKMMATSLLQMPLKVVHEVVPKGKNTPKSQGRPPKKGGKSGKTNGNPTKVKTPKVATVMPIVNETFVSQPYLNYLNQRTSSPITNHQPLIDLNGKEDSSPRCPKKRNLKGKDERSRAKRRDPFACNRCVQFLGERYIESEFFDNYCDCENDCQMDELSMTFDLLIKSKNDHEIPRDLRRAIGNLISSDEEEEFANLLPLENDVLQQTQREAQQENGVDTHDLLVDDFLNRMTAHTYLNSSIPAINGLSLPENPSNGQPIPSALVNGNV